MRGWRVVPPASAIGDSASLAVDLATAGAILLGFLVAMAVAGSAWRWVVRPLVRRTATELDDIALPPLRSLLLWGLFLSGLYYAAASLEFVQANPELGRLSRKAHSVAWTVLVIASALRAFNAVARWYLLRISARPGGDHEIGHQVRLASKAANVLLVAIGVVFALRAAGADISPLLASGAIGGLAVALALQDTLSNLFAGFFLAIDRPVKVGDFIKLESGEEGFVDEIGWRNTRVRPWANTVVIVPNSKLSQSRITNFYLPQEETAVYVPCGVSYDSDLQRVEEVTLEVAREVVARVPGANPEWEPVVRWKEFGESAVTFVTTMRVREFSAQYLLQSEFVKALHRRFGAEGIEIPLPRRVVVLKSEEVPAQAGAHGGRMGV